MNNIGPKYHFVDCRGSSNFSINFIIIRIELRSLRDLPNTHQKELISGLNRTIIAKIYPLPEDAFPGLEYRAADRCQEHFHP